MKINNLPHKLDVCCITNMQSIYYRFDNFTVYIYIFLLQFWFQKFDNITFLPLFNICDIISNRRDSAYWVEINLLVYPHKPVNLAANQLRVFDKYKLW